LTAILCCHITDNLPSVSIPEFLPDTGRCMTVRCNHQWCNLREITRNWRSTVVSGICQILQPNIFSFKLSGDLAKTGLAVFSIVLLVIIDLSVNEEDPMMEMCYVKQDVSS